MQKAENKDIHHPQALVVGVRVVRGHGLLRKRLDLRRPWKRSRRLHRSSNETDPAGDEMSPTRKWKTSF